MCVVQNADKQRLKKNVKCITCHTTFLQTSMNQKFCNRSCAAQHNNKIKLKNIFPYTPVKECSICGSFHSGMRSKYCIKCKPVKKQRIQIDGKHTKVKPCYVCGKYMTNYHGKYCNSCSPNINQYRSKAKFIFNIYDYPHIFNLDLIEKHGWYSPNGYKRRNKKPNLSGVSRDHLYSVAEGFRNNIDPKLLGHPANCGLIIHNGPNGNSSKKDKCSITIEELKTRILEWQWRV